MEETDELEGDENSREDLNNKLSKSVWDDRSSYDDASLEDANWEAEDDDDEDDSDLEEQTAVPPKRTSILKLSEADYQVGFPNSFAAQLVNIVARAGEKQEKDDVERTWKAIGRSKALRQSVALSSRTARARTCLPCPNFLRSLLHESQLIWISMQLGSLVWMSTQFDWKLRLRGPLKSVPNYEPTTTPWLPGQRKIRNNFRFLMFLLIVIYIPCGFAHLAYVLDDAMDE